MFYDLFEKLCLEHGYSVSGACKAMGRSKGLAAKWKKTGDNPSYPVLKEISDFFGVSIDYLSGKEETKTPVTNKGDGQESNIASESRGLTDEQQELIRLVPRLTDQEAAILLSQVKGWSSWFVVMSIVDAICFASWNDIKNEQN